MKKKAENVKLTLRNEAIEQRNAIATLASGDSMMPTIKDGDTIHIDLGRKNIKDGKILLYATVGYSWLSDFIIYLWVVCA